MNKNKVPGVVVGVGHSVVAIHLPLFNTVPFGQAQPCLHTVGHAGGL